MQFSFCMCRHFYYYLFIGGVGVGGVSDCLLLVEMSFL